MQESSQLFYQAATLMVVGMGFVYAFLGFLILVIKGLISPLAKYCPDEEKSQKLPESSQATPLNQSSPVVAAISAAIARYRQTH
jgi:oxaloacetate decarboxylase (Na+ extruding) subunit gamma